MNVEQKVHPTWANWKEKHIDEFMLSKGLDPSPLIGKYQYIYSSEKGKISLVELPDYFKDGKTLWEIYSLEGDLFEDIERFDSKEEAENTIEELLK